MHSILKNSFSVLQKFGRFYSLPSQFKPRNDYEEIQIPFEWGPVRGKLWGLETKKPILALHGWQENCGTFDTLIPHLHPDMSFLAIDLPGHGRSTHLPRALAANEVFSYLILIRRIQKMLDWPKVALMGHSMGAIVAANFAMHYPKSVDILICFDGFTPQRSKSSIKQAALSIDKILKYERTSHQAIYNMDELEYRVRWNSDESIAFENCSHIIKRNVTCVNKDPMLFQFSTDPRLKAGNMISIPKEDVLRLAPRIKVPVLLFKATQNSMLDKEGIKEEFEEVWEIVEMYSRDAEMIEVEGTHHLHLNTPRKVAAAVNEFLDKYYEPDYLAMHLERC